MAYSSYEYATGFNNSGSVVNIETIVPIPPRSNRVPIGGVTRYSLDNKRFTDGAQIVEWVWGALSQAELAALVVALWGTWNTENAELTIGTRLRDDTYAYFNAIAHLPRANEDYILRLDGVRENIIVRFYLQGTAT